MGDIVLIPKKYHCLSGSGLKILAVPYRGNIPSQDSVCCAAVRKTAPDVIYLAAVYRQAVFSHFCFFAGGRIPAHAQSRALRDQTGDICSAVGIALEPAACSDLAIWNTKCFFHPSARILRVVPDREDPERKRKKSKNDFSADCCICGFFCIKSRLRQQRIRLHPDGVVGACFLTSRWQAGLAFIPIGLYNGRRGFIHGKVISILFYTIYPVHMLILYWIKKNTIGY